MLLCIYVAVCADNNHVRTWTVTRFRGMISTQPGSTPLASFKIISLEETESHSSYSSGNDIGECREVMIITGPCVYEVKRTPKVHLECLYTWYTKIVYYFYTGPFGERDDQQVFIQKVIPITNKLFVRLSSTGKRFVQTKTTYAWNVRVEELISTHLKLIQHLHLSHCSVWWITHSFLHSTFQVLRPVLMFMQHWSTMVR